MPLIARYSGACLLLIRAIRGILALYPSEKAHTLWLKDVRRKTPEPLRGAPAPHQPRSRPSFRLHSSAFRIRPCQSLHRVLSREKGPKRD